MKVLEAHARLAMIPEHERPELLGGLWQFGNERGEVADAWPAAATAAVVCTGWLPQLETDQDLREALQQFASLRSAGIVSEEDFHAEIPYVVSAVMAWGAEHDPAPCEGVT